MVVVLSICTSVAEDDEVDCPASPDGRTTTNEAAVHSSWDSIANKMTYYIDTINKPGGAIKELCIYPNPAWNGNPDTDLIVNYPGWREDVNKPNIFGFMAKTGNDLMSLDGSINVLVGSAIHLSRPTETYLLHLSDTIECGGQPTCWKYPGRLSPPSPVAKAGGPYTGLEGSPITFNASSSTGSNLQYRWDFNNDGIWDTSRSTVPTAIHTWYDDHSGTVALEIYDGFSTNTDTAAVTVNNVAPIVNAGPYQTVNVGNIVSFGGSFTDPGTDDTHTYSWNFGDGISTTGTLTPTHTYSNPGVYIVNLTVRDDDGGIGYNITRITVNAGGGGGDGLPTQPLCPVAIATGPNSINVSWWISSDDNGVSGYRVYRSIDNTTFYPIADTTNLYYIDTTVSRGITYYYSVRAIDTIGQESIPSDIVHATPRDINPPVITISPITPIPAEATSPSGSIVDFSVTAIDDIDGSLNASCTPYNSGNIFPLGYMTVTCSAKDSDGNLGSAIYTVRVVDTTPPTDPTGLTATAISSSRIDLVWMASTDIVGVLGYWIYRSMDNSNFDLIASTSGTSYSNNYLTANTTYYYYVKAVDTSYNPSMGQSNTANATTLLPAGGITPTPIPPPPGDGGGGTCGKDDCIPPVITITILTLLPAEATSTNGAPINFEAIALDNRDGQITVSCTAQPNSIFPVGFTELYCTATDSSDNTGELMKMVQVVDTTPPSDPTNLIATAHSSTRIDLTWTASTDIVGVLEYWIYRGRNGISFELIGSTSNRMYVSNGLIPNTTYYYYVKAIDTSYNPSIGQSNTASATTFPQPPSGGGGETPIPTPTPVPTPPGEGGGENPCSPPGNTPLGQIIEIYPTAEIGIQFDVVLQCGDTTAVAYYDNMWIPLPSNYQKLLFYEIDTTAVYQNYITVRITYSQSDIPSGVSENSLRVFHYENDVWVDVTTALDTTSNIITGRVSSLSPFGIAGVIGGGGGGGGGVGRGAGGLEVKGSSFDVIGFIILSICLVVISIFNFRRKI